MLKYLIIGLLITGLIAQDVDTLFGDPSTGDNSTNESTADSTGNGDELVVDTVLPFADGITIDGEATPDEEIPELIPLDIPVHFDGEETP